MIVMAMALLASNVQGKVYFQEKFDDGWRERWVDSVFDGKSKSDMGEWKNTAGKFYGDNTDKGLQTGQDAKFYGISAEMSEAFNNDGKDLVIQFSAKHEQNIDCGGGYIKLLPGGFDQSTFGGATEYAIMFGPDICGTSTRKTHVIFNYKGENLLTTKDIKCETDELTHVYTLILKTDNTYEVQIDGKKVEGGKLEDDWKFLKPKMINDPEQSKPTDWVDEKKIPDPEEKKPEGYDDVPEQIPDPDASKPEDWDDEDDGEWEAPMIDNPEYKGEWKPTMIDNPDYKGEWEHPQVANPDYEEDDKLYAVCGKGEGCSMVGFELWQVKAGTIFDNIIVTDDIEEANALREETFDKLSAGEKAMKDEADAKKREEEEKQRKEREEKQKEEDEKKEEEEDDDEDDDDEDDDDDDDEKDEL
jgi:calreticulin